MVKKYKITNLWSRNIIIDGKSLGKGESIITDKGSNCKRVLVEEIKVLEKETNKNKIKDKKEVEKND